MKSASFGRADRFFPLSARTAYLCERAFVVAGNACRNVILGRAELFVRRLALVLLFSTTYSWQLRGQCAQPPNAVVAENCLPGSPQDEWDVSTRDAGDPSSQGFSTNISVNRGGVVLFKIKTDARAYAIDIYRLGYYAGLGARKVATITPSVPLPQTQPACLSDPATGLVDCGNWAVSASWQVPANAASGIYFAHLTRKDTGGDSHIAFIVRNDTSQSAILYQTADETWQAYNYYGGGSLYGPQAPRSISIVGLTR